MVATGCYVQVSEEEARADAAVDLVLGNNQKRQIVTALDAYFEGRTFDDVLADVEKEQYEELEVSTVLEHTRAFVKVQDGCNQFCSYCIIPYARGRVRSRRMENVIAEIKRLAEAGIQEVVLTGIHLSSYGREIDGESHLIELIEAIHPIDGISRIRLGSLEPRIITEEFVGRLKKLHKVCPHFHLSLQSGCEETLKRMNRHYTPEEYYEKCKLLRAAFENPAITTDVIVGFPGETDEEFDNYALYCRGLVGALGFVSYDPGYGSRFTPRNTDVDLELYLEEKMKYPRKQFLERWESSPPVIKKYEILYAIIRDELGVEL